MGQKLDKVTLEEIDAALRSVRPCCADGCCCGEAEVPAERRALARRLLPLVERLDERKRMVITERYGLNGEEPKTLQAIGTRLGRTRERIRQIQNMGLLRLREQLAG